MTKVPQFIKEGWRQHGPGQCKCPHCGAVVSTNALARARHSCPPKIICLKKQCRSPLSCSSFGYCRENNT